ncbi:hypothetical protein SAMN05428989_1825 [Pseudoxanthomonas sp. GM95]|uniref:hypothetical protein n=1 Tax=Pseudoxanthomonas sp. GM95 TaxID=1881043 RepID=UPI0008BDF44B|nr:hypothetical protein [Pseudoxanthomonas sp. GM95]SEL51667.1 hypothetical protein SAMN05428989_1825 [Pseudoxanthomonas sp. GM95]
MKMILVIFFLSIQSSYSEDIELPATKEAFDTVQFYAGNGMNWRIKTYAKDQDVHIWSIGDNVDDLVALAKANTEKHYGDVLSEAYVIETDDGLDGLRRALEQRGLAANLELPPSGAVFWAPPGSTYRSKSTPR